MFQEPAVILAGSGELKSEDKYEKSEITFIRLMSLCVNYGYKCGCIIIFVGGAYISEYT